MNITPINAVSFEGEWRKRKVCIEENRVGTIGNNYYKIVHTYHPYADESPSEIKKTIAEKQAEFAKAEPIKVNAAIDGSDFYSKVVNEKLGKTLLSSKAVTRLKSKQAKLQGLQTEAKRLLGLINAELVKVGKKLALKPKAPRKRSIRVM